MKRKLLTIFFHKDSLFLILVLMWAWLSIGMAIDQQTDFKDLNKSTGQIEDLEYVITKIKDKPLFKDTTCEFRIKLSEISEYFTVGAKCLNDDLVSQIEIGETVTVFTKPRVWGLFGLSDRT
jgi:hypothetical protein